MGTDRFEHIFTQEALGNLFPKERADQFFESLLGDPREGAYDIRLAYKGHNDDTLNFEFLLLQRPQKCLACHLTAGLPSVFSRHPVINIHALVREIEQLLDGRARCADWNLAPTVEKSADLHVIPLNIRLSSVPSGSP